MSNDAPLSEGYDVVLEWLAKEDAEKRQLKQEVADLKAQLDALLAGKNVSVVIGGTPFYLSPNAPTNPAVALHVVVDSNQLKDSFLLTRDTGEQEAIFQEPKTKTA